MIGALNPAAIIAAQFAGPQSVDPRRHMMSAQEPFIWGQGGRRLTPEDIARERQIGASMSAPDFSPVSHWTQGLGRVAQNLLGAMRERDADKASAANQQYSADVINALMKPDGGSSAPPGSSQSSSPGGDTAMLSRIIADPYVDRATRDVAKMQYENALRIQMKQLEWQNREQPEIVQLSNIANDPSQPAWRRKDAQDRITALNDPLAIIPDLGGGIGGYVGPRSQLGPTMERQLGGGQAAPDAPDTLPPDFDFGAGGATPTVAGAPPAPNMIGQDEYQMFVRSMGRENADRWLRDQGLKVGGY